MAITFIRYFYIGAGIRWLLSNLKWPSWGPFTRMLAAYNTAVTKMKTAAGIRVADFVPFDQEEPKFQIPAYVEEHEVQLSQDLYNSLFQLLSASGSRFASVHRLGAGTPNKPILNDRVNHIKSIEHDRMTFATRKASIRNSFVLFSDPTAPADGLFPRAGQISEIVLHGRRENGSHITEAFFLVDEYEPLQGDDLSKDPYLRFPDLETRYFYNSTQRSRLVRLGDIHSHFAALFCTPDDIGKACVVVCSLDRVSPPLQIRGRWTDR